MIATDKYIEVMVPLIVQLWPDNTKDEAIEIIEEYLYGEETGAFVQVRWGILKVSLSMRSSESMELQEHYALNVNNGRKIKAVKSLQAIVK